MIYLLFILLCFLNLADAYTTYMSITTGVGKEGNPVMAWLFDKIGIIPVLGGDYLGRVPRAINDTGLASSLARGTKFGAVAGSQITVTTDAIFGFDWRINYPRSFSLSGPSGDYSSPVFRISSNTGVFSHVLPLSIDFDSSGNVRKRDLNTSSGYEFTRYRKTDNPGGGMQHLQIGMLRSSFTRAELLAIAAKSGSWLIGILYRLYWWGAMGLCKWWRIDRLGYC